MTYNEHFEFRLVRSEDDDITDIVTMSKDGPAIRSEQLAEIFNSFLTACGYVGHNYEDVSESDNILGPTGPRGDNYSYITNSNISLGAYGDMKVDGNLRVNGHISSTGDIVSNKK